MRPSASIQHRSRIGRSNRNKRTDRKDHPPYVAANLRPAELTGALRTGRSSTHHLFLLGLTVLKLSGLKSALLTLGTTLIIGCAIFGLPITAGAGSILSGFLSGAWPIGWIVLMAVWLYRIAVRAGNFDIVRASVSSISNDQRIQVLLIAFCFGGFIEGAAGFGIPIAISAALLVSLGFNPLKASMLALVANAASGAYGAIGIPVTTAAKVGGLDTAHLSAGMVPVLQIFVAFVPLLMVAIQDGMRGIREVGLVALMTGVIFSGGQAAILMLLGSPELVDIIPPLLSLVALALVMQKWQPKHIFREPTAPSLEEVQAQQGRQAHQRRNPQGLEPLRLPVRRDSALVHRSEAPLRC